MRPYNICEYETINYQDKKSNLLSLFLLIIGIIVLMCSYKIKIYNKYIMIKENDTYLLTINALNSDDLLENDNVLIKGKEYEFEIISKEYDTYENIVYLVLHVNIFQYDSDSNYTYVYTLKSSRTVFESLINFFLGGNYDKT